MYDRRAAFAAIRSGGAVYHLSKAIKAINSVNEFKLFMKAIALIAFKTLSLMSIKVDKFIATIVLIDSFIDLIDRL